MANEVTGDRAIPPLILAVETSSRTGSVAIALGSELLGESLFSSPLRHSAEVLPAIRELLDRFGYKPAQIEHVYISSGPGSFTGLRIGVTLAKTMYLANAARIVAVDTLDVVATNVIDLAGCCCTVNHGLPTTGCNRIAAVLDAKRGQFFIAVYERQAAGGQVWRGRPGLGREGVPPSKHGQDACATTRAGCPRYESIWRKILPDSLMTIPQFLTQFAGRQEPIWLLGDGLVYYRDKFQADGICFFDEKLWSPRAHNVHLLGWEMALKEQFADPLALVPNYLRKPDITLKQRG